jgi:hypothetical protein
MNHESGNVKIPTFIRMSTTKYEVKYLLVIIIVNTKKATAQNGTTVN